MSYIIDGVKIMKKIISSVLAALMMFSVVGCSTKQAEPPKELTIGVMPDVDSIPLIIADKQGFFEKAGVKVKLEHFKSAKDRDSALQSGKLDGVVTDVLAVAFSNDGGFDLKITSKSDGEYKLIVGGKSNIKSMSDMVGKSIALSTNTIIEYSTDTLLKSEKVDPKDVKKTAIPQIPTRLEMLQNNKIDAATLPEPMATVAIQNGAVLLKSTADLKVNAGVIAFTGTAIKDKDKGIAAFYKAYNQAVDYLNKEKPETYMDTVIKEAGFPEGVKDGLKLPKYTHAAMPSNGDIESAVKWLKDKELTKKDFKSEDLTNNKYVK